MKNYQFLSIDQINIHGGTQCRISVNRPVVTDYARKMREGVSFPPISTVSDGKTFWLVDGYHRLIATKEIGNQDIEAEVMSGSLEDAQDMALGANDTHGLARTNEDKRQAVETALSMKRHEKKSDREIAKLCKVSHPFVAAIRNPDSKEKQSKNLLNHVAKKSSADEVSGINSTTDADPKFVLTQDYGPDEAELRANELAYQEDLDALNKLLEADDKLAAAHTEITRLNHLNAHQSVRINLLTTQLNEAIKQAKRYQRKVDSLQGMVV
jgi:hypothetical protein